MATQPPLQPDRVMPQSPPETPPLPNPPGAPQPDEADPVSPDIVQPGYCPEEFPSGDRSSAVSARPGFDAAPHRLRTTDETVLSN
jgi:hypothetical protein